MARLAGKHRGDMRAMEEQMERHNPLSGRANLRVDRRQMPISGMGATPSMGLSQFRGGAYGCGDSESDEEMEGGGFLSDLGIPVVSQLAGMVGLGTGGDGTGAGTGGMTRMVGAGSRKKKGMSEATQMGLHLGKHLHSLHGAGFFDDFKQGFMSVIRPAAGIAKSVAPLLGPEGMAASGVLGALGLGKPRRGRGTGAGKLVITHGGASNSDTGAYEGQGTGGRRGRRGCGTGAGREREDRAMLGMGTGAGMLGQDGHGVRQGGGFLSDLGIPVVSQLAGMVGLGTGAGTGGRRRRAPAGPSDGRRKRAEVVKKVMAEKGLSMIEASKFVKANNLY